MPETFEGDVLHVAPPDVHGEYDLEPELIELAAGRHVLVCREGGHPSWFEQLRSFILRKPIRAVTIIVDEPAAVGDEISVRIEETEVPGVYTTV